MPRQGVKHNVNLTEMPVNAAVQENLEDGLAELAIHHLDPRVKGGVSKVTITVIANFDENGQQSVMEVSRESKFAPRKTWKGSMFWREGKDGLIEAIHFDPKQPPLDF